MANLVIIGGVAAGMSAASKAKRLDRTLNIIALEKSPFVSYGACGMPYNLLRPREPMEELVVISAEEFREKRGIDVRVHTLAEAIDIQSQTVTARNTQTGAGEKIPYDKLVYAAGAEAVVPPLPGVGLKGIFSLRNLVDGKAVKEFLKKSEPKRAAIIGAGPIGLEMAHVLTELGLKVSIVEKLPGIMPGFEPQIVEPVRAALTRAGVEIFEGATVQGFGGDTGERVRKVMTDGPEINADMALVAVGIRPVSRLAQDSGISVGFRKAVAVDRELRTSARNVWAAGDCAEQYHKLLQKNVWVPLGTNANKQGRIAGENAAGGHVQYPGMIGSAAFRTLGVDAARTGLNIAEARDLGCPVGFSAVDGHDSARSYGKPKDIRIILIHRLDSGQILGAQMAGSGVAKRCDIIAAAIFAGMTIKDLQSLDLTYAPPFAPVWDPVLVAANVADKDFDQTDIACRFCDAGILPCGG